MPRSLVLAVFFVSSAAAAIWPDQLGKYQRKSADAVASSGALASEYGFDAGERADYGSFQATATRFKDPTGAYAASLDPANKGAVRVGNYLVACQGRCPKNLANLADMALPHVSDGALPSLGGYFPSRNMVPRSERYVLGPAGLASNAPQIPAAAALFDFGTEAQLAQYRVPGGPVTFVIFSFPAPSIARQQLSAFQKIPGAEVKRAGRLVAVIVGPGANSTASAKLLDSVQYRGVVAAQNDPAPEKPLELKPESAGKMVLSILTLAGILLGFCLLSGLAVGGSLRVARRFGYSGAEGSMTTLHIEGK